MTDILQGMLSLPERLVMGQIIIDNGIITDILLDESRFRKPTFLADERDIISPGFIDIQINGAFGKEFKTDEDAIAVIRKGLPKFGTTSFCPTVTTKPIGDYPRHISQLSLLAGNASGAKWLGFHLEGPFLNPEKVGAQAANLLEKPIDCPYDEYVSQAVKIVTLAPELEGSSALIKRLIADGCRVGVGHSTISYDDLVSIFDPEKMIIVHVYNAMSDLNSRKPGVLGAALDRDDYFCSVIADGIHVSAPSLRVFWKSKRDKSKVICITDGSAVAGMDLGIHRIGSRSIEKREDRAVLEGTETLVGSILTLNVAVRNMINFVGCSVTDAINCVSQNPANFLGMSDKVGAIKESLAADIVVLDKDFNVKKTYIDGVPVW